MRVPAGSRLAAFAASLALLLVLALSPGPTALDTLQIDLRHRWVAVTASGLGAEDHAPGATLAVPPPANPIGANVFLEQEVEPAKRRQSLALLRAAGVGWIRQQVPWEQVEPDRKASFDDTKFGGSTWTKYDEIVDEAQAAGLQLILRLDTAPRWALPADAADGMGPPLKDEDYWDFVEAVATRYRGRVRAYQVWNEPNLHIEWGRRSPNPAAYARLLRGAAERVRRADPDALVLMASLAPTLTDNAEAMNDLRYLQALYDAGVKGSFDVLAVQAYGLRGGPDDPRVGGADVTISRPELVRRLLVQNGDADRPLWATEMGWNVNPPSFAEQRFGRVTPVLQARYTVRAFERARQEWPWMQVLCVWYWKRPDEAHRDQDWYWFRMADPDFQLQPVYFALRDQASQRGLTP